MQLSRPIWIALVGAVLVAAVLLYTRSQGGEKEISPEPAVQAQTGTTGVAGKDAAKKTQTDNDKALPGSVKRALARHQVIVLFLRSSGGAEERLMKRAVSAVRGGGVVVISDSSRSVSRYSRLTDAITRTPVIVVVDRKRRARIFEGYVDEDSVREAVRQAKNK